MSLKIAFGKILKQRRAEINISQEQLALRAEIDRTFISKLERGIHQPSLETLFAISKILECDASELIRRVEKENITFRE